MQDLKSILSNQQPKSKYSYGDAVEITFNHILKDNLSRKMKKLNGTKTRIIGSYYNAIYFSGWAYRLKDVDIYIAEHCLKKLRN